MLILGFYIHIRVHNFTSYLGNCIIREKISPTRTSGEGNRNRAGLFSFENLMQDLFLLEAALFKSEIIAQIQRILCTIPYVTQMHSWEHWNNAVSLHK